MNIIELHVAGGVPFMIPLSLILIANIGLIAYAFILKENLNQKWLEAIKQLGGLALAWGAVSTLAGLFQIFDVLSQSDKQLPFYVIMGGLKVAFITTLYGFGIFLFSLLCLIILKLMRKNPA